MNRIHRLRSMVRPALGFTLTELLIVMLIIVILISLLLPVVSKVKTAAYHATTQQEIDRIAASIQQYYSDFQAYPGIFKNDDIGTTNMLTPFGGAQIANTAGGNLTATNITETENMELSLLGGLIWASSTATAPEFDYGTLRASKGAVQLLTSANYKQYPAYMIAGNSDLISTDANGNLMPLVPPASNNIPTGIWNVGVTSSATGIPYSSATDSAIPEFVDCYMSAPMPIVYLRAKTGNYAPCDGPTAGTASQAQYNYTHLYPYFLQSAMISGVSTTLPNVAGGGWTNYFANLTAPQVTAPNGTAYYPAKNANGFWLIDPGDDRIFGTADDICYGFSF